MTPRLDDAATLAATARLVWAAASPQVDAAAIQRAIDDGADPDLTTAVALVQRTAPLTWRALADANRLEWLGEGELSLRRDYELRRAQGMVLLPHALQLAMPVLVDAGMEPVIFKGPALARRYADPGLRPMDDIDVLIEPDRHDDATRLLTAKGWKIYERSGRHYDTILHHPDVPDLALELHRGLETWKQRTSKLTADTLWRARVPLDCLGTRCFGLPPEVELAALAAHAGKPFHIFRRLVWSVDLAVVIQTAGSQFDWDRLADFSRRVGTTTVVAAGLIHARRLGADVPDRLVQLPDSRLRRLALAPLLEEGWPLRPIDEGVEHRLRYALRDVRRAQALLLVGELTDGAVWGLPERVGRMVKLSARRLRSWRRTSPPEPDGYAGRPER